MESSSSPSSTSKSRLLLATHFLPFHVNLQQPSTSASSCTSTNYSPVSSRTLALDYYLASNEAAGVVPCSPSNNKLGSSLGLERINSSLPHSDYNLVQAGNTSASGSEQSSNFINVGSPPSSTGRHDYGAPSTLGTSFLNYLKQGKIISSPQAANNGNDSSAHHSPPHSHAPSVTNHHHLSDFYYTPHYSRKSSQSVVINASNANASSNWKIEPFAGGNVGLHNAINALLQAPNSTMEPYWIGLLPETREQLGDNEQLEAVVEALKVAPYRCEAIVIGKGEKEAFYDQFCKQALWPILHYILPDYLMASESLSQAAWQAYVKINEAFADRIASIYQPGDLIWIHDYHLLLLPRMLKDRLPPQANIAFFLHVPFPSSEVFRCLYVRKRVLEGMLGASLIGFQTYQYARHFLQTCSRILGYECTPKGIHLEESVVAVGIFPIGINAKVLLERRKQEDVQRMIESLRKKYADKRVLIGRDKLDATKGVQQKLLAFEKFLEMFPQWIGKVVLIQVALSTREQHELSNHVTDLVSRINSRFGTISYRPVVYLKQNISFSHYLALLSIADACLITSLRDGMNLTSHEYIVCQVDTHKPLIISEFTGACASFSAAIRVNPWNTLEVVNGIQEALNMSPEDQVIKHSELYNYVTSNEGSYWTQSFLHEMDRLSAQNRISQTRTLNSRQFLLAHGENYEQLVKFLLLNSGKSTDEVNSCIFFFDYESIVLNGESLDRFMIVLGLLNQLSSLSSNVQAIILSSQTRSLLEEKFDRQHFPHLGLVAENGCFIRLPGHAEWNDQQLSLDKAWRDQIYGVLLFYTERTPGSTIERKEVTLTWNYGAPTCDPLFGSWMAKECQTHIQDNFSNRYPIHVLPNPTLRVLDISPRNISKLVAAQSLIKEDTRLIFFLGDAQQFDLSPWLDKDHSTLGQRSLINCSTTTAPPPLTNLVVDHNHNHQVEQAQNLPLHKCDSASKLNSTALLTTPAAVDSARLQQLAISMPLLKQLEALLHHVLAKLQQS